MSVFLGKKVLEKQSKALFGLVFVFTLLASAISLCFNNNTVSAYSASISNSGPISTSVTPKNGGTGTSISTDAVNVTTNCRAGYNLTIAGPNDRNLYKDGNSANNTSGQYFTPVDGTSQLKNTTNAWGYSLTANTDTGIFTPLPNTPTPIRTPSQTASETDIDDDINIYYGVSVTNTLNPGSYTMSNNDTIVYQLTMDMSCNAFTVSYNANGGTGTMEGQDIVIGQSTKLTNNTFIAPAKGQSYQDADGTTIPADPDKLWVFWGWNTEVDGTGDWYKDTESVLDLGNSGDTITLYAQWKQATLADLIPASTPSPSDPKAIDHNTMQDMSAGTCWNSPITTAATAPAATLTDSRGGTTKSYNVSKLADNNCWMTTNLALGSATDDITLTSDNTDLADNTSFTLPAADTTAYTATTNLPKVRLTNNSGTTDNGAYYTWNAAVANTTSLGATEVTTSICPKNWDLPTRDQYTNLSSKSSYSSSNPTTAAPSSFLTNGGFTNGASFYDTSYSHFWTANSNGTNAAYGARVNSTTITISASTGSTYGGNKYYRKNIRCVASAGNANITYHSNNTAGATSTQSTDIGTGKLASSNLFTPEPNRQFKEWNTRPDGTGTSYAANASASSAGLYPDQSLDLYAIWNEVYYIAFDANEASVGGTPGSATGTMTNQTVPRNIATAIKTNTFALTGYIFRGWNTAADGTGTFYGDGQKVTNLTSTGNTTTLYAVWVNGALLDIGQTVNRKLKRLAGNSSANYSTQDNTITAIARSNALPNGFTPATENTISDNSSPIPIYAWYDSTNTTIYYYSDATKILMNKSSDSFFREMRALSDLSTISAWDTTKVVNMSSMFSYAGYNAPSFTLDLSSWNTASVTDMSSMFSYAGYSATTWSIGDLSSWNTASVTTMYGMFSDAGRSATTWSIGDLSSWNTASVTNMQSMFSSAGRNATTWSVGDLSLWNTASVTNMEGVFLDAGRNASSFVLDLSSWDISNVTTIRNMFQSAGYSATTWSIGDLSLWNTANVTSMNSTFMNAGYNASSFILDLSLWNTASVTDMFQMFQSAGRSATTWSIGDLSSWNTASVTNMSSMFYSAGYSATTWSIGDLSLWNTASVTTMSSMFSTAGYSATTWSIGDLSLWNTASVTYMQSMFSNAGYSATTWSIGDLSLWNTASVTTMYNMFSSAGRSATTWSIGDLSLWNTASVTNMSYMFSSAGYSATTWSIGDLSLWNTASVTTMYNMFSSAGYSATTWSIGDLSLWNTASVTTMESMFSSAGRSATTWSIGNLSSWNTASVTNMSNMFNSAGQNATSFILDLSSWNTASVTNMNSMFRSSGQNSSIWSVGDLSSWNTSNVSNMQLMFFFAGNNASIFILNLSSWNTSNVTNMSDMISSNPPKATTWSVTIPKTNDGTATGPIANTTSNLYGKTTSVTLTAPLGKSFTLAD